MKAERTFLFLVVCSLMFCGNIFGQKNTQKISFPQRNSPISASRSSEFSQKSPDLPVRTIIQNTIQAPATRFIPTLRSQPLALDFYSVNLSFFCKKELQIEKLTSVPFRFRLGSLAYVDYLEQKPNATKIPW